MTRTNFFSYSLRKSALTFFPEFVIVGKDFFTSAVTYFLIERKIERYNMSHRVWFEFVEWDFFTVSPSKSPNDTVGDESPVSSGFCDSSDSVFMEDDEYTLVGGVEVIIVSLASLYIMVGFLGLVISSRTSVFSGIFEAG